MAAGAALTSSGDQAERRWDIGVPRSLDIVGMPLLEAQLLALDPQTLADAHVLCVNHAISDALMVARAFRRLGAKVTSVLVPYRGGQGETQRACTRRSGSSGTRSPRERSAPVASPERWPQRCRVP